MTLFNELAKVAEMYHTIMVNTNETEEGGLVKIVNSVGKEEEEEEEE
eukprot:CAMPEP_0201527668 /NCGR_PEP_ID=MMETSP0161_2-20130828/35918_1 /ASSEMBLY_ACC=CAM_ASM_000251 /TAXON_ID=180227 /ORGANISM="Neoparamoeba aestuarina, Strain SoJaBio B1-5/56/2" /LENGTH=46 /DNA_ID= /DNA_START= /DNA_END= /DNA_ORIENTATION=